MFKIWIHIYDNDILPPSEIEHKWHKADESGTFSSIMWVAGKEILREILMNKSSKSQIFIDVLD